MCPDGTFEPVEQCPKCGSDIINYRRVGPHIRAECGLCEEFIKFCPQYTDDNWRKKVKEKAFYKCERCGKPLTGRQAHAHHKVPQWFMPQWRYRIDNGMCLCPECHRQIHGKDGTIKEQEELNNE